MEDVKILGHWVSPFVLRARIALNLKKVDYELIEETLVQKSDLLLKSNPVHKKIPVLFHNGIPICESLIIVEYIDETWTSNHSILPEDPHDRAIARFWASFIDQIWFPRILDFHNAKEEEKAALQEQIAGDTQLLEEAFKTCSKGGNCFGGEDLGFLDIALGSFLNWTKAAEIILGVKIYDREKLPLLAAWGERFCSDASVKEVVPDADKIVEYYRMMIAKLEAAPSSE